MSLTNAAENSGLLHWFNNTAFANFGDASGLPASAGAGTASLSLSNVTGLAETDSNPTTNEGTYTGYTRQTVARSGSGWTVSGTAPTQAANAALIQFGNMTAGGPVTEAYVGLSFHPSGTRLDIFQALTSNLVVNNGVNPQFAIGALVITLD